MIIEQFSRLRGCGIFRDFSWPSDLQDFDRFNLIYGWNGTGKSTLGRLLRKLEQCAPPPLGDVTLQVDGHSVRGRDFTSQSPAIRVFNRDYVDDTVLPREGGEAPPIYVVGKENVDKQRRADALRSEREVVSVERVADSDRKTEAENALERHAQSRARTIKEQLRSQAPHRFNNYDRAAYLKEADELATTDAPASARMTDEVFDTARAQLQSPVLAKIPRIELELPDIASLEPRVGALLSRTVASGGIAALRDDSELAAWVQRGHKLHQARESVACLYCAQEVPPSRAAALDEHFNTEHQRLTEDIERELDGLRVLAHRSGTIEVPRAAEFYPEFAKLYSDARDDFQRQINTLQDYLRTLIAAVEDKGRHLYESLSLTTQNPELDSQVLGRMNDAIAAHNLAHQTLDSVLARTRESLARHLLSESIDDYVGLVAAEVAAAGKWKTSDEHYRSLTTEISALEREIVAHREPAEDLNRELAAYLGHAELRFEISETGYAISRPDAPAFQLSEGERTAIALLYFMKSLTDRDFEIESGVVVLDDPVSSLDANALYLAFGIIQARLGSAGQIFVLTHNFTFFREVHTWFKYLPSSQKKLSRYYMLECSMSEGQRSSRLAPLDPLLLDYKSEYHFLFSRVAQAAASNPATLEQSYGLPNMARRLLEGFLEFRFPGTAKSMKARLDKVDFDEGKKVRILSFLNAFSHGDEVDDGVHDLSLLAETSAVLNDVLAVMEAEDPKHCAAMRELVETTVSGAQP